MTLYLNGMSAGTAGHNPAPSKRGQVNGWSAAAVRRHSRWLYSIDSEQLDGLGVGVTLTMRDIPANSAEFHAARRALLMRLQRWGAIRIHWVVEWTRRRRPHLHMAVYFPADELLSEQVARHRIVDAWMAVAGQWGTEAVAQHVLPITGPMGWLKYLSKHAARGVAHYQRQGRPEGWEKTGRLWGYGGAWPAVEPMQLEMSRPAFWRMRRLIRSWRIADARQAMLTARTPAARAAARRRIVSARTMLSRGPRSASEAMGVSEWAPEHITAAFAALLAAEGHLLVQR